MYPDIVDFCDKMANQGKIVIVAALDGDYEKKLFNVLNLIPKAEYVIKINAVRCSCYEDNASFSKRRCSSETVDIIGGSEKYKAVCRECCNQ